MIQGAGGTVLLSSYCVLAKDVPAVPYFVWKGFPAFPVPPGSQASSRGEAKDSALLSSRDVSLPLGLALGSPIFPSGCEGKLGVALESLQGPGSIPGSGRSLEKEMA